MADSTGTGLFLATWDIGGGKPGAPTFRLAATVDTVRKIVTGVCHMSQATLPPPEFTSNVSGDFSYLTVMPDITHILVVANGTGEYILPPPAIGTILDAPNFRLRMVLNKDWRGGTANVSYLQSEKPWQELQNLPVRLVPNAQP